MYLQRSPQLQGEVLWLKISSFIYKLPRLIYRVIVKNAIDSALAMLALVFLFPLLILIAIQIKRDSPGPILIRQKCEGLRGYPFYMYKFRTHEVVMAGPAHAPTQALRETYIGKVLREANLENLPQLFNVFISDMSLVGPRPELFKLMINNVPLDQIVPNYKARNLVKPGMTGWAQINGLRGPLRSINDIKQRFSYDLDYTKNVSFHSDRYIISKTIPLLKGAVLT